MRLSLTPISKSQGFRYRTPGSLAAALLACRSYSRASRIVSLVLCRLCLHLESVAMDTDHPLSSLRYSGCSHVASRVPVMCAQHISWRDFSAKHGSTPIPGGEGERLASSDRTRFARKCAATLGSKTCNGLTYLKLTLVNVSWLLRVSVVTMKAKGA